MTTRKLEGVSQALDLVAAQKNITQFLSNAENAQKLNDLVDDIREAVMDYQVCTESRGVVPVVSNIRFRLRCTGVSTTTLVN